MSESEKVEKVERLLKHLQNIGGILESMAPIVNKLTSKELHDTILRQAISMFQIKNEMAILEIDDIRVLHLLKTNDEVINSICGEQAVKAAGIDLGDIYKWKSEFDALIEKARNLFGFFQVGKPLTGVLFFQCNSVFKGSGLSPRSEDFPVEIFKSVDGIEDVLSEVEVAIDKFSELIRDARNKGILEFAIHHGICDPVITFFTNEFDSVLRAGWDLKLMGIEEYKRALDEWFELSDAYCEHDLAGKYLVTNYDRPAVELGHVILAFMAKDRLFLNFIEYLRVFVNNEVNVTKKQHDIQLSCLSRKSIEEFEACVTSYGYIFVDTLIDYYKLKFREAIIAKKEDDLNTAAAEKLTNKDWYIVGSIVIVGLFVWSSISWWVGVAVMLGAPVFVNKRMESIKQEISRQKHRP